MDELRSDPNRRVIVPLRSELDMLQTMFQAAIETWRRDSPRNAQLLELVETEIAKERSGD
jgi:hypothetical protein